MTKDDCAMLMASKLLAIAAERFYNNSCNDLPSDFYDGMDADSVQALQMEVCANDGTVDECDPNVPGIGDARWMDFLSDYIKRVHVGALEF